jgi:VCBS repeat-containing protein
MDWLSMPFPNGWDYSDDVTIVIDPPHTNDFQYALDNTNATTIQLETGLYFQNAFINRDVIIRGAGMGRTTVSGGLLGSVFRIARGCTVYLEDMTIIDGLAPSGGGVFNDGTLFVTRCEIKNCRAYNYFTGEGGGIFNRGGARLTVRDSAIRDNIAARTGGGISSSGFNLSRLPSGSGGTASNQLAGVRADLATVQSPAHGLTATNELEAIADQFGSNIVRRLPSTNAPSRKDFLVQTFGDPFGNLAGWENMGSPVCVISNSVITGNRVGAAAASADAYSWVCYPQITGYYCVDGDCIPEFGGFTCDGPYLTRDPRALAFGGGIHNDLGLLTIQDCTITDNEARSDLGNFGGGLSSMFGALKVTNSKLNNNRVDSSTLLAMGGAVYSFATYTRVSDSQMTNNTVSALFLSSGGAIKNTAASFTEIERCQMDDNTSGGGGAIANDYYGILQVNDSTLLRNSVSGIIGAYGGGLRNEEGGQAVLDRSTISGNSARGKAKGGGLYNQCTQMKIGDLPVIFASTLTLRNCTISSNVVNGKGTFDIPLEALGAGIYNGSSRYGVANTYIASCTVYANRATNGLVRGGGGVYSTALSDLKLSLSNNAFGLSLVELGNTLVAKNEPEDFENRQFTVSTFMVSLGYNMDSDGSGSLACVPSDQALAADARLRTAANPRLGPLQNNGGFTPTHALLPAIASGPLAGPASPAQNAGSPDDYGLPSDLNPPQDQRGLARSLGGRRDIGAFEGISPRGNSEVYETLEDRPLSVPAITGVLRNDFGSMPTTVVVTPTANGTLNLSPDGGFTYTPNPNFTGTNTFTYRVRDVALDLSPDVTVTIIVRPRLDWLIMEPAPGSLAERYHDITLTFDEPVTSNDITANVLVNGSVSGPHGFVPRVNGTKVLLEVSRDFLVGEQVTVTILESMRSILGSPIYPAETRTYSVFPNRAPTPGPPESYTVSEEGILKVTLPGTVLSNDADPDGDAVFARPTTLVLGSLYYLTDYVRRLQLPLIRYEYVGAWPEGSWAARVPVFAEHGQLEFHTNGTFTYQPEPNFNGTDSFSYIITDGVADAAPITVTLHVTPVNDPPVAVADFYPLGTTTVDATQGVLANDIDIDNSADTLRALLVSPTQHGTLVLNLDGSFTYTPTNGYTGSDAFDYRVSDGLANSAKVRVKLGNTAPIVANDSYPPALGKTVNITDPQQGLLANDTDFDGELLTARLETPPAHGSVVIHEDGTFAYTPTAGNTNADTFTYRANDGFEDSGPGRVKLGNTAPVAVDDTNYFVFAGQTLTVAMPGILGNDLDADGDPLVPQVVTFPGHGTLVLHTNGLFTYTPEPGFTGRDAFTYRVSDGMLGSAPATVGVAVYNALRPTGFSPERNSATASSNGQIQVTFNSPLDPATVNNRITVFGSFSGRHNFTTSVSGQQLTIQPMGLLHPGELVSVSFKEGIRGTGLFQLQRNFGWQFTIHAPRGGATFTRMAPNTNALAAYSVALGDLNGDGRIDGVVLQSGEAPLLYFNAGNRVFTSRTETLGMSWNATIASLPAVADFNGDGLLDIVAGTGTRARVGLNNGDGTFSTTEFPNGELRYLFPGDLDGDGDVDLFGVGFNGCLAWLNDGTGHFSPGPFLSLFGGSSPNFASGVALGDVDGDGDLDAYIACVGDDKLVLNDGAAGFSLTPWPIDEHSNYQPRLADVDADGDLDLLLPPSRYLPGKVWSNDGTGRFTRSPNEFYGYQAQTPGFVTGDFDGDGDFDTFYRGYGPSVSLNSGTGRFTATGQVLGYTNVSSLALADLDGDGDLDVFSVGGGGQLARSVPDIWYNQTVPKAADDFYPGNGPSPLVVNAAAGVLANDQAGDGGALHALLAGAPAHGSVLLQTNGAFTYTPNGTFTGADVFTYSAVDGTSTSAVARVKIGNSVPSAVNDLQYVALNDSPLVVNAPGVLANDIDPQGDPLSALLETAPAHGTVVLGTDGSFQYTAVSNYVGSDSFTYRATDGLATSTAALVKLDVRTRLALVSMTPTAHTLRAPADEDIVLRFNRPLNAATVASNVFVAGRLSGPHHVTPTIAGETLTLNPLRNLLPGEEMTVTLADGLEGSGGERLVSPVQFQFIVEAPLGRGQFVDSGQRIGDTNYNSRGVALGDFNGDGFLDAFIPNGPTFNPGLPTGPRVWFNNGAGFFADSGQTLGTNFTFDASAADLDGDGDLDVVAHSSIGGPLIYLNNGSGIFSISAKTLTSTALLGILPRDVNNDGAPDLLGWAEKRFTVWLNDGAGHFTESPEASAELNLDTLQISTLSLADLDGDADLDIVVRQISANLPMLVWRNDGQGVFSETGIAFGRGGQGLALGDINGDGFQDVLAPDANTSFVWFNDGAAAFSPSAQAYGNYVPISANLADVNGDGFLDAVLIQRENGFPLTNRTTVLINDGLGEFTPASYLLGAFGTNSGGQIVPASVAVADLDRNGAPDLFITGGFRVSNQVWLNAATLTPLEGGRDVVTDDTVPVAPFTNIIVPGLADVALTITLDDAAKGTFTAASLAAAGFTGPAGNSFTRPASRPDVAQAAVRQLVFAPTRNRVPVGENEVTLFQIVLQDGSPARTNGAGTLTSISVNDAPQAVGDSGIGFSGSVSAPFVTASVLANDLDADPGDALTIVQVDSSHTAGTVVHLGNGTFRYTPRANLASLAAGEQAVDSFAYTVRDPQGAPSTAVVRITLNGENDPPIAVNDVLTLNKNSGQTALTALLLANDSDTDSNEVALLIVSAVNTNGTRGRVLFDPVAGVAYDPSGAFPELAEGSIALDSFTYTIIDPHGSSATATATLRIRGVDEAPSARPDAVTVKESIGSTNLTSVLLANDSDPDAGQSALLKVTGLDASGTVGTANLSNDVVTYTPAGRFQSLAVGQTGSDTFRYSIASPTVTTIAHTAVPLSLLQSDTFVPVFIEVTPVGTLSLSFDKQVIHTNLPLPGFGPQTGLWFALGAQTGTGSESHDIDDLTLSIEPEGAMVPRSFNFDSGAAADSLVLGAAGFTGGYLRLTPPLAGQMGSFLLPNLATNRPSAVAGFTARFKVRMRAASGAPGNGFSFVWARNLPEVPFGEQGAGYGLVISFRTSDDGNGDGPAIDVRWQSATAETSVTVTVTGENDAPTAAPDHAVIDLPSDAVDLTANLLSNDTDPDEGETAGLKISKVVTNNTLGSVTFSNGVVLYRPPAGLQLGNGQVTNDTFFYTVQDIHGQAGSNGLVTVYLVGHNSTPVASPDAIEIGEDSGSTVLTPFLLANDTDTDPGDTEALVISSIDAAGVLGTLALSNGVVTFDPSRMFESLPAGSNALQSFSYTVQDRQGATATAQVTLTIRGANDSPSAQSDFARVLENASATNLTAALLANDTDVDATDRDTLFISAVDNTGTLGAATFAGGIVTYSPNDKFNSLREGQTANDTFRYVVSDLHGGTSMGTVVVTVVGVKTAPAVTASSSGQNVQYSDAIVPVTVTANDADSTGTSLTATTSWRQNGGSFSVGLPTNLALTASAPAASSRAWTLAGKALVGPGTYIIRITVTDETGTSANTETTIAVQPEDARVNYTGANFVATASANSSAAIVTLAATVSDITAVLGDPDYDANAGDIRNARVSFINLDNNTVIAANLPVGLVNSNDLKTGSVVYNWNVNLGSANSQSFAVGIVVSNYYARSASADGTIVTVSRPLASDFITGGGYLVLSNSGGLVPGAVGSRANFGFNVKYSKSGNNLQGALNMIVRNSGRVYQIKANVMTSLSVSSNRATFNGKANIQDITDPLAPLSIDGNGTLQVKITDNGEPGSNDTLGVTLWNKNGGVWFASSWNGMATTEQRLAGGNLVVRSGSGGNNESVVLIAAAAPKVEFPSNAGGLRLSIRLLDGLNADPKAPRTFAIQFPVVPEADYVLERSTDLLNWTVLSVVMSYTDQIQFLDDAAAQGKHLFYRVRPSEPRP